MIRIIKCHEPRPAILRTKNLDVCVSKKFNNEGIECSRIHRHIVTEGRGFGGVLNKYIVSELSETDCSAGSIERCLIDVKDKQLVFSIGTLDTDRFDLLTNFMEEKMPGWTKDHVIVTFDGIAVVPGRCLEFTGDDNK